MAVGEYIGDGNPDGTSLGSSATEKVSLYGVTPVVQPAGAALSATLSILAIPGASFVADAAATVSGVFAFTSLQMTNLIDALQEIRASLKDLGAHKGGA